MKKLFFGFMALVALSVGFQSCDNTKTYAEMLDDEKAAINEFIAENNIRVISQQEFFAQDSTTNLERNEYVQLASGVYMQIVKKGVEDENGKLLNPNDTVKNNSKVLVRFTEYDIIAKDSFYNTHYPNIVDEFQYTKSSSSIAGIFTQGLMYARYGTSVPAGWLVPLSYVKSMAHVRLIIPSKMGHQTAIQYVYPYYYDLHKIQIW